MAQRQHVGSIARQVVPLFARYRLLIFRVIFSKATAQNINQWQIQTVQPDHRLIARVTVIVPLPLRGQNKVAGVHLGALAVHGSERAFPFHNKA